MLIVWKNKIWKRFSCIFSKQMNYSKKRLFILYSHNYTSRMFSLFKCKIASQLFLPKIVILKHLAISRQIFSNDGFDAIIFHRLIGHLNIHWQCPTGAYLLFLEFCSVDVTPQFLYQCLIRLFLTLTVFLVFHSHFPAFLCWRDVEFAVLHIETQTDFPVRFPYPRSCSRIWNPTWLSINLSYNWNHNNFILLL